MAKITVAGQAVVLTSSLKLEDIKTIKKYRPKALIVYGGDDGKELEFAISAGTVEDISKNGICFANETRDGGYATITLTTSYAGEDIKDYVADEIGTAFIHLQSLEDTLEPVIEEIEAQRAELKNSINIVE